MSHFTFGNKADVSLGLCKIYESIEKYITIGKISSSTLLSLTEDFLDMAKMEAGTFSINEDTFKIDSLLCDIDFIFRIQCEQKGLKFEIDCKKQVSEQSFWSDPGRIKQILMNLLSNAFKFTSKGSITVKVDLETRICDDFTKHRYLMFKVKDTGVGIDTGDIPELFTMFKTLSKHKKQLNKKGTGLGLSISKKLWESLGGKIRVKSQINKGSTFMFEIMEKNPIDNNFEELKDDIFEIGDIEVPWEFNLDVSLNEHIIFDYVPSFDIHTSLFQDQKYKTITNMRSYKI